jgi:hypothetical protein
LGAAERRITARLAEIDKTAAALETERSRLLKHRRDLRREIEHVDPGRHLADAAEQDDHDASPTAQRVEPGHRLNLADSIASLLKSAGPLHRDEIARRLDVDGFDWGGRDPVRRVGSVLGRNRTRFSETRRFWWHLEAER